MALISGEVTLVCFYKNLGSIRLWEFIIAHVMKTMKPIFHPTALRRRQFDSLTTLRVDKRKFKVRTSVIGNLQVLVHMFDYVPRPLSYIMR